MYPGLSERLPAEAEQKRASEKVLIVLLSGTGMNMGSCPALVICVCPHTPCSAFPTLGLLSPHDWLIYIHCLFKVGWVGTILLKYSCGAGARAQSQNACLAWTGPTFRSHTAQKEEETSVEWYHFCGVQDLRLSTNRIDDCVPKNH